MCLVKLTDQGISSRLAIPLALLVAAGPATAEPEVTQIYSTIQFTYADDVSNSDLLHGLTPTVTGWQYGGNAHPNELTDGIHGLGYGADPGDLVQGAWTTVGATAEYHLGTGANGTGYDITSVASIAAWENVGFGNQAWTLEVKPVGGSYSTLATVFYQPLGAGGATKITLSDPGGVLATGIEYIKVTAHEVNGGANAGAFVWRELDVFGTPSSANETPPAIASLSPADDVHFVSVGSNLSVTFNEAITPGTGNITIKDLGTSAETVIPVDDAQVSVSDVVLTINPAADLAAATSYAVRIDPGAVEDLAGHPFAGISDDSTWNFTTLTADAQQFSTTELAYQDDASTTDLLHGLTPVTTGWQFDGNAHPNELTDGIHGGNFYDVGWSVEGAWTTVGATAEYNLGPSPGGGGWDITAIRSIAAWDSANFGNQAWTLEVKPVGGSYTPLATVDYQPLTAGPGATKVTLTAPGAGGVLATGVEFVKVTANQVNGGANLGAFVWRELDVFGAPTNDETPPTLDTLTSVAPADGATGVPPAANLEATFSEPIALTGAGSITLRNLSGGADIPVTLPGDISISGAVLTINPASNLVAGQEYAVEISSDAVRDLAGNPYAGLLAGDTPNWSFTAGTKLLRIMCLGDSITVGYTDNPSWANHPFMFGYRSGLYTRLTDAGYNFLLVGASTEPWTGISGDPTHGGTYTPALDLRDFDQDGHRGYGGAGIGGINAGVAAYIAADEPDVILLLIGINGIGSGSPAELNALVNTIVTTAPDVHLIVAQITPLVSFNQDLYNYNVYIRDTLVPTCAGNGHKVTTVDLYSLFLADPDDYASAIAPNVLANGINHPDNPHYDLMAQRWFDGIEALGLGPNTYARWIGGFDVGARTGFADDPDGDHIPNGVENYFGTDPGTFSSGLAPGAYDKGAGTFTFTHPENPTPATDLTPAYRWSKDLVTFHANGATNGEGTRVDFNAQPDTPSAGVTTVTATVTGPALGRLFADVEVTRN